MTNYGENRESPDAIKAEIERTRSQMSNKIDTLQERLNPDTLKVQAQEAIRTALQDGADAMKHYVQEHSTELRDAVIHVVKRNPLPTALIGIGVGWLVLEGFGSAKQSSSNQYDSSNRYDWSGGRAEYAARPAQNYTSEFGDRYRSRVGAYAGSREWAEPSDAYWSEEEGSNGHNRPIGEKVQQLGSTVKEKAGQAMEQVQDAASQVVGQVADKAQQAREQIGQLGSQVTDKTQSLSEQTRQQVSEVTIRTQQQAHHMLEDNPLAVGAAALAVGAVIGLLLPSTRRENEMVGPYRDQVVEKAQSVAGTVAQRVQEVVQEVKPEVEQLAHRVVEQVKPEVEQLGQRVAGDLKQTAQEAASEATGSSAKVKTSPEEDNPMLSAEDSSDLGQGWSATTSTQETTPAR
jgi:ElaB/YqjD/DUF883 family membrane-anchored ribosome-binding protein